MSRIKIKHFGPLATSTNENDGWLEIKKVTIFIGNQGSGKSTIAKLISTCVWIEKVLTRGDFKKAEFKAPTFRSKYCGYHRISNYFKKIRLKYITRAIHTISLTPKRANLTLRRIQMHVTRILYHR